MTPEQRATKFVHLVAQFHPTFGAPSDKLILNTARNISDMLRDEEGLPRNVFSSASGVPLTRRRS